ncbi:MAG: single-stranded DNA-binding protein [candidate division WOR-3 bacterium]|jgi:single-strand DNA-binding protein
MAQLRFPNINFVILSGRLVNDASPKTLPSGKQILEFRVASNRRYLYNNEQREENLFINCIYIGQRVLEYSEILKTGYPVVIEGRLRYREWTDTNNNKRSTYEIIVSRIHLLEKREVEDVVVEPPADDEIEEKPSIKMNFDEEEVDENDIPF